MPVASGDATVVAKNKTEAQSHSMEATEEQGHAQNPGHTLFSGVIINLPETQNGFCLATYTRYAVANRRTLSATRS